MRRRRAFDLDSHLLAGGEQDGFRGGKKIKNWTRMSHDIRVHKKICSPRLFWQQYVGERSSCSVVIELGVITSY